jgi:hypothetical protein
MLKTKALAATAAVIVSGAATLTILAGTAGAVGAANCNWKPGNNSWVGGYFRSDGYNSYNLYKGPAGSCDKTGASLKKDVDFTIRCRTTKNPSTTLWYYITDYDTSATGWVSASNVFISAPGGTISDC